MISELYQFIWNDFCDLYIELSKKYLTKSSNKKEIEGVFNFVFSQSLNLINPVIPFITEKIGYELGYIEQSYFNEQINKKKNYVENQTVKEFEYFIELVKKIRFEKNNFHNKQLKLLIFSKHKIKWIEENIFLLQSIFDFEEIIYAKEGYSEKKILIVKNVKFILDSVVDKNNTISNVSTKEIEFYKNEIKFFEKKLNNKQFMNKAPKKIIEQQKKNY